MAVAPSSVPEVEREVLAALLVDPRQLDGVLQQLREDGSDFLDERHRRVFRTICRIDRDGRGAYIDLVTVSDRLEQAGELEAIGGNAFLKQLTAGAAVASNAVAYAQAVREHSIRRQLLGFAAKVGDAARKRSSSEVLEEATRELFEIAEGAHDSPPALIEADVAEVEREAGKERTALALSTGFPELDKLLGGLKKSDLVIVGARPGEGKTSLGLNIALSAGKDGHKVLIFSIEMPRRQIVTRLLFSEAEVDATQLQQPGRLSDSDVAKVQAASQRVKNLQIYVDDSYVTPVELRSKARQLSRELDGLDLIVVDYLQLMSVAEPGSARFENRTLEIANISRTLKVLAGSLRVPILALSQLNRDKDKAGEFAPPKLSHLRESGALEQDADVVLLLHRPGKRKGSKEETDPAAEDLPPTRQVIVAKNRNGPIGVVELAWRDRYTRFESMDARADTGTAFPDEISMDW